MVDISEGIRIASASGRRFSVGDVVRSLLARAAEATELVAETVDRATLTQSVTQALNDRVAKGVLVFEYATASPYRMVPPRRPR